MRHRTDKLPLEEPLAKRLRSSRPRNDKATLAERTQQLPSPRETNSTSTDNLIPSSSVDHNSNPKPNSALSFRDRLLPPPTKDVLPSVNGRAAQKRHQAKASVTPFFKRVEAAFQDDPSNPNQTNHHGPPAAFAPLPSPSPDPEDLIKELQEHYLRTASTLHDAATAGLARVHASLSARLDDTLLAADEAFLAETEAHIRKLSLPLDKFTIRSQQQQQQRGGSGGDGTGSPDGAVVVTTSEENSVGELLARAEAQVRAFEEEVGVLWREWAVAEGEVKGVLKEIFPIRDGGSGRLEGSERRVGGGGDGEGEIVKRFREAIERDADVAEEEILKLGDEAVRMMKEIEKEFRKATLPDLHSFFQSIDEP